MITYCPLKLMAHTIKGDLKTTFPGGMSQETICDRNQCGFWSAAQNMCGIAAVPLAINSSIMQPDLPPEEDDKPTETVINPEVKA